MKKILLDTLIFLWWIDNQSNKNISPEAQALISNPENEVYVSIASLWEIGIKQSLGALTAPSQLEEIIKEKDFDVLGISVFHTEQVATMPYIAIPGKDRLHKDPFDRMLVAQAQAEGMYLISADSIIPYYPVRHVKG